jgi:hypothetical protein
MLALSFSPAVTRRVVADLTHGRGQLQRSGVTRPTKPTRTASLGMWNNLVGGPLGRIAPRRPGFRAWMPWCLRISTADEEGTALDPAGLLPAGAQPAGGVLRASDEPGQLREGERVVLADEAEELEVARGDPRVPGVLAPGLRGCLHGPKWYSRCARTLRGFPCTTWFAPSPQGPLVLRRCVPAYRGSRRAG